MKTIVVVIMHCNSIVIVTAGEPRGKCTSSHLTLQNLALFKLHIKEKEKDWRSSREPSYHYPGLEGQWK